MKKYINPELRIIDLIEEGMIAASEMNLMDEEVGEEFTQKQEGNFWDREGIWK